MDPPVEYEQERTASTLENESDSERGRRYQGPPRMYVRMFALLNLKRRLFVPCNRDVNAASLESMSYESMVERNDVGIDPDGKDISHGIWPSSRQGRLYFDLATSLSHNPSGNSVRPPCGQANPAAFSELPWAGFRDCMSG
jgi:hypothetical protein